LLSNDRGRLQVDLIENFLSMRSYWAEGRPREIIERSIQHSVCLGIYKHGLQVAFARLVTDKATFAWLDDVYVEEAERGQGLGKWLLEAACQYIDRCGIQQSILMTDDAQTLYQTYGGFKPLSDPEKWMSRQTTGSE